MEKDMLELLTKTALDTFQSAKKTAIDTFVKHEGLAKTLNKFVDAQAEYTKKAVEATFTASSQIASTLSDKAFYADNMKALQDEVKSWTPNKKEK